MKISVSHHIKSLGAALLVIGFFALTVDDMQKDNVCMEWSSVAEVMSISHRDGVVKLANGQFVSVGQPHATIKVGTEYCLRYERK